MKCYLTVDDDDFSLRDGLNLTHCLLCRTPRGHSGAQTLDLPGTAKKQGVTDLKVDKRPGSEWAVPH